MLKSIAVVLGGYVLSVVLVLCIIPCSRGCFRATSSKAECFGKPLIVSTAFFVVISIFCAWVCARFAPGRAGRHVLWFFLLGEVMDIVSIIPNWNNGWPHWYWLSWLIPWPVTGRIRLTIAGRRASQVTA
jgi:hypothetical protein